MKLLFTEMLRFFDLFGVPVKVLTERGEENYKSLFGGLISIIISVTSLTYFIYMMNLWIGGSIGPNIQVNQNTIDYAEFDWSQTLISFKLQDAKNVDPFSRINNIITPLLFKVTNQKIQESPLILYSDDQHPLQILVSNGSIVLNSLNIQDETHSHSQFYILVLASCNDNYISENGSCASKETIDQYLSEFHGFLSININLQQYSVKNKQLEAITKTVYQGLSKAYPQYTQISIMSQETIVDDGILLENKNYYKSINNFEIINQQTDSEYITNILKSLSFSTSKFEIDSILALQMTIDNITVQQEVTMPKLNVVLAQIGSIIQVIFFLKYIALYVNKALLNLELSHNIITMYYPNLKNIKISRDIVGKSKVVSEINYQQRDIFLSQYEQLIDVTKQKCRLSNILYEISRLQFILEEHLGIDVFQGCHYLGSKAFSSEASSQHSNRSNKISIHEDPRVENEKFSDVIKLLTRPQFGGIKQI